MNPGDKRRRLLFDAAMIVAVVVMGATMFWLNRMQSELEDSRRLEATPVFPDEYFAHEYAHLADRVRTGIEDLHGVVTQARTRNSDRVAARFESRSREFAEWLDRQRNRPEWERFRSQRLKERIGGQKLTSTNGVVSITQDLLSLIEEMDRAFKDYLSEAQHVVKNAGKPLTSELTRTSFEKADASAQLLLALSEQARQSGVAIDRFLKTRPSPNPPARAWLYLFETAAFGVLVVLFIAFRSMAVAPLRLKVVESNTVIEQQNKLAHFGQLAAGLAHEIRNPLTAINARLFTLQKKLNEGTGEFNDAALIRGEIQRLDRIVQDFLRLARPADPKMSPMAAEPLLRTVHDLLAPQCESRSVVLKVDTVADAHFRADEQQLKQALINLVQNAAESMDGRPGSITLRARNDRVKLKGRETGVVILEVEDTGPGIPQEVQERLFDPFFSTKEHGTGLGLPITARIVEKHGGTLRFDTKPNHGTTFGIVLPIEAAS